MPEKARIDAPGVNHNVFSRGIEKSIMKQKIKLMFKPFIPYKQMRKDLNMKRRIGFVLVVALALITCFAGLFSFPSQSLARSVVPVEGSQFDTTLPLIDNLKYYTGKNVFIHLKSGKTLQGYVKAVGNNLVHLEKLTGKDFYDALISIDQISAMEAKFREMK